VAKLAEQASVVNAYVSGGRLKLLHRSDDGELCETYTRAEWSLFTLASDLPKYDKQLRASSAIRSLRVEGDYVRISCVSYDVRDRLCRGRQRGEQGWFEQRGVKTFEADLTPVRRWLIDSNAPIQKPIPGYLDLESDSRVPFARKGEARILCWGFVVRRPDGTLDKMGGLLAEDTDAAEREMLLDMIYELEYVDQVLAWNGELFDFELIAERFERLDIQYDLRRWLWLDHMELFKKFNITASESGDEKASLALNRVADSLGVLRKVAKTEAGAKSWEAWFAGGARRQKLLEDCVEDAATMERIENGDGETAGTGYVATLATLAETCGVFPNTRGMQGVNFVESFLMRLGAKRGMRAPTKFGFRKDQDQFRGAFVFPTRRGLYRDVHICDFARLYPSIMQAWNMSPETHVGQALTGELDGFGIPKPHTFEDACRLRAPGVAVCPITVEQFRVDGPRGLFAEALDIVVEQRKYWSKLAASLPLKSPERRTAERRDSAYKIIANTFYGVSGSPFSRYFLRELSESVTQIGVWLIQHTSAAADPDRDFKKDLRAAGVAAGYWHVKQPSRCPQLEGRVLTTIAGDTDSAFFRGCSEEQFTAFIKFCNETMYPGMIAPSGADARFVSLAFEKSFSLMINVEKKTYAGRVSHKKGKRAADDEKPVIKGLEYKRGDTARLARELQEQVVREILMIGKPLPDDYVLTPRDLERSHIEPWQRYILGREFDYADAVIAKAMKKPIGEYGGQQANGQAIPVPAHVQIAKLLEERGEPIYPGVKIEYVVVDGSKSPMKCAPAADAYIEKLDLFYLWETLVWSAAERVLSACWPEHLWKRWGSVRPLRTTLPGQEGFGWGERSAPPVRH
jgi:DNA polymerase elongation subunit (family B)